MNREQNENSRSTRALGNTQTIHSTKSQTKQREPVQCDSKRTICNTSHTNQMKLACGTKHKHSHTVTPILAWTTRQRTITNQRRSKRRETQLRSKAHRCRERRNSARVAFNRCRGSSTRDGWRHRGDGNHSRAVANIARIIGC